MDIQTIEQAISNSVKRISDQVDAEFAKNYASMEIELLNQGIKLEDVAGIIEKRKSETKRQLVDAVVQEVNDNIQAKLHEKK